jgi:hypothetical protein
MTRRGSGPAQQWADFANKSMGFLSARSNAFAIVVGLVVWLTVLGLSPVNRLSIVVFTSFAALALGYTLPAIANRKHWPAQAMFLWAQGPRPSSTPADDKDGLVSRVNAAIAAGSDEPGSWLEARALVAKLPPNIRREHALAMVNLFENGRFDEVAYEAAVAEVTDLAESRYWRVQFAVTKAFAAYQTGEDYMQPLLEASKREGPFSLTAQSRLRIWIARVGSSAFFLIVGIVAAVGIRIAEGV